MKEAAETAHAAGTERPTTGQLIRDAHETVARLIREAHETIARLDYLNGLAAVERLREPTCCQTAEAEQVGTEQAEIEADTSQDTLLYTLEIECLENAAVQLAGELPVPGDVLGVGLFDVEVVGVNASERAVIGRLLSRGEKSRDMLHVCRISELVRSLLEAKS